MGTEDVPQQPQGADDKVVAAELRLLAARVDALERELGALRAASFGRVAPPPRPAVPPVREAAAPVVAVVVEPDPVAVPATPAPPRPSP